MKIFYISNNSPTTKKAHGLQIAKMCEALADSGAEVELILPDRSKRITKADYFGFYGVRNNFKLVKLPVFDFVRFGKIGFLMTALSFGWSLRKYLKRNRGDAVYTRDPFSLFFISRLKYPIYFEAHKKIRKFLMEKIIKSVSGVIAITRHLANEFEILGMSKNKIIVAPDGVDLDVFDISVSQHEARVRLGLPQDKKICLYSGNLKLPWKGVNTVVESAKQFTEEDIIFVLIGMGDGEQYNSKNVLYAGHKPQSEVPLWLKAADILLLPNTSKDEISRLYTSPLKMFEYMAAGHPIIASDLQSIREVLNEDNACLVPADNPKALTEGIKKILADPEYGNKIAMRAHNEVTKYTWHMRIDKILKFIKQNNA